ncbi:hypothetical protein I312_106513 [Cryptococcus bacillisporus CA1280]|uniref:uncharacterized protein n=1 Tax=Cryptococcus bacillisporus CA1280 TaxID=1296109 RepID=UPI00336973A8
MGEEVETKERGRTWSPEQGSGEGTSDGHGNRDENGLRRKTVYFTDSGRQGVGRKGMVSMAGYPISMVSAGQPSGRQSVQQFGRQPSPSPSAHPQLQSRSRLPPYPRVGPANSGWVSNPGGEGSFESAASYTPLERLDRQSWAPYSPASMHTRPGPGYGYGVYSSPRAPPDYPRNTAVQSQSSYLPMLQAPRPHTPSTGTYYLPPGDSSSPNLPPTIAASLAPMNTRPSSARGSPVMSPSPSPSPSLPPLPEVSGESHEPMPMPMPSPPANHCSRVQFSPLPTPSQDGSASSSSARSARVQNGSPRSGQAT